MSTPRWEDRWPGRFQHELDELRAAGISFAINKKLLTHRILYIDFVHTVDGRDVRGYSVYPDLFPDFRPAVQAELQGLSHHQNPLGGNLCLLGRGGDRWRPSYTLAWLLKNQLPKVLASGRPAAATEAVDLEDCQAEPYSAYLSCEPNSAVLVDSGWKFPPEVQWGRLVIGTPDAPADRELRAAVLEVNAGKGDIIASADPAIARLYPHRHRVRWARSDLRKPEDLMAVIAEGVGRIPEPPEQIWPAIQCKGGRLRLLGVVIPEETGHRRSGQGWIFAVQLEKSMSKKHRKRKGSATRTYFARPVYAGRTDLDVRVPELEPLRARSIAVFGLGSLGAPAALEFARAGAREIRLLDRDHVDAGPTVRWPFGLKDVGRRKAAVLHEFIRDNYPYTKALPIEHELGAPASLGRKSDQNVLDEMLNGVDLVFDATANLNVQRILAELSRERGIPYVMVEGRYGGWGGVIFRQAPGPDRPCLYCLLHALQPGGGIVDAPAASAEGVQPRGCGDVTFTGTAFDMTTIALDAVRRAVASLCDGKYPDPPGNVAVISLRREDGSPCAPTWATYDLKPHKECNCSAAAA